MKSPLHPPAFAVLIALYQEMNSKLSGVHGMAKPSPYLILKDSQKFANSSNETIFT